MECAHVCMVGLHRQCNYCHVWMYGLQGASEVNIRSCIVILAPRYKKQLQEQNYDHTSKHPERVFLWMPDTASYSYYVLIRKATMHSLMPCMHDGACYAALDGN